MNSIRTIKSGQLKMTGKLKLLERFQTVKISDNEYKFVSLSELLTLKTENDPANLLDVILPMLKEGCEFKRILKVVGKSNHSNTSAIINNLFARGLLERVTPRRSPKLSLTEVEIYTEPIKFFSNFHSFFTPPSAVNLNYPKNSFATQEKLKELKIMLIGLGRIGSRLAETLAFVGIGNIIGCDKALITKNETRDSSFSPSEIGTVREEALKSKIKKVNNFVKYSPFRNKLLFDKSTIELPDNLDLLVLCEDEFNPDHYNMINNSCLNKRITCISCRNLGLKLEIGPTIVPYETACFKCYELRKMSNSNFYEEYLSTQKHLISQNITLGSLNITFGYNLLALEIIKLLTNFSRAVTYGSVFSFDLISFDARIHPVLKIPRCPDCGRISQYRPTTNIWQTNEAFDIS